MMRAPALALAAGLLTSSCGATLMKLPQGPGGPVRDTRDALAESTAACRAVSSVTAEIAVSGSLNGQRVRASLVVGLAAPDAARVEARALGQPLFVFVSRGSDATLLLQQDNRSLEHGAPDLVLEAVTGVPIGPASLRQLLTGCPTKNRPPGPPTPQDSPSAFGDTWQLWQYADALFLHRPSRTGPWQLVAVERSDYGTAWRTEYRQFVRGLPTDIHLVSHDSRRFDLHLKLSQVEINETLDERAFRVQIPASADPISLDELRRAGPFGGAVPAQPRSGDR